MGRETRASQGDVMLNWKSFRLTRLPEQAWRFAANFLSAIFAHPSSPGSRTLSGLFLVLLFLFGARMWGIFYSWGNISFDFLDWVEVTGPRYALLRSAAEQGVLPLHSVSVASLRSVTDRYFSIADTPFSPQYLLLPLMETGRFIFWEMLGLYTVGFIGLLLLYRRYRLSPFVFFLLFFLFNFNGYIVAHLAVGHSMWIGHFLMPYFALLVLRLVELDAASRGLASARWRWVLATSLLLLAILLQGFFHLYLWCLMFLALMVLANFRLWKPVALAGIFTGLLSLPRLLPPSLILSDITQEYLGGFPSLTNLVSGMVVLRDPRNAVGIITDTFPLQSWETDFFVGLLGFLLLLGFGVAAPVLAHWKKPSPHTQILLPSAFMTIFSIGGVFGTFVSVFTLPPLTGERVTSRMFEVPMVMLLVLGMVYLQRALDDWDARRKEADRQAARNADTLYAAEPRGMVMGVQVLFLGLAYLVYHDLRQHMQAWRIRYLDSMVDLFPKAPFDPAQHTIANHPDAVYTGMLLGGTVVALAALALLVYLAARERSSAPAKRA
jgi:hypothetical protein